MLQRVFFSDTLNYSITSPICSQINQKCVDEDCGGYIIFG